MQKTWPLILTCLQLSRPNYRILNLQMKMKRNTAEFYTAKFFSSRKMSINKTSVTLKCVSINYFILLPSTNMYIGKSLLIKGGRNEEKRRESDVISLKLIFFSLKLLSRSSYTGVHVEQFQFACHINVAIDDFQSRIKQFPWLFYVPMICLNSIQYVSGTTSAIQTRKL